ncbi:MAG TPA: hypothetical protein VGM90_37675 [Kofleriaceae bacterium]|jgi:hypothetical protein
MGRGTTLFAALALASLAACQPLYGGKAEKLHTPDKKKHPPEPPDAEVKVQYIDDCAADFRGDPARVTRQSAMSSQLVGEGETAMQSSDKAKDPNSQAELIKVSISKFSNALQKDPYNHDATLDLALAYDKVNRKGCALALLKRLSLLQANPKFSKGASLAADRVADTPQWFRGYRKDAIAALGR